METLPSRSYYGGFESFGNDKNEFVSATSWFKAVDGGESPLSSASRAERKSTESSSSKSHKEAERRRRQRINNHLSTLRTLLPNHTKSDKASLLAEVVHHVRELRKQVDEVARQKGDGCCTSSGAEAEQFSPFPGESDEVTLSYCDCQGEMIRVSVCCDDRPGLNHDLSRAIRSVQARAVRAEMMTVGGRTKNVVVMKWESGGGREEDVGILKRALNAVVENRASVSGLAHGSKRARVCGAS